MSDADRPAPDEDRTVFRPAGAAPPADAAPPEEATVYRPAPPPGGAPPSATIIAPAAPLTAGGSAGIKPGDVLNHIFKVERFIARGGMGEVFQGVNVNTDEAVAIKVILPAMAADPNVQALFRQEAITLTRLSHPALVQYRLLAQEPQLGVHYIVTEYIEGANLSDVLDSVKPDTPALRDLTRRLAEGLRAAHVLGAIHRDMSPDNVLLQHGRLDRARIIDFGIAKDLDPGKHTIIGDGFAGKLGYVAPEQLGDFGRQIGPWTDVYSLGLVLLAVAAGRGVDMGTNFAEALDRRRAGPDLSPVPEPLRPVLAGMLAADPAQRFRSMDAVIEALDAPPPSPAKPASRAKPPRAPKVPKSARPNTETDAGTSRGKLIAAGGVAAALVLGGGAFLAFGGGADRPAVAPVPVATPGQTPAERARRAVAAALPAIPCTWLDLDRVRGDPGGVTLSLAGVAGRPAEAQAAVARAADGAGVAVGDTDFADVAPISASECGAIDAFRLIRAGGSPHLSVPQRKFEMARLGETSQYAGQLGARAVVNLDIGNPAQDFALYGIEPNGAISAIASNRAEFDAFPKTGDPIAALGGDRYRIQVDINHTGWSGILLVTGDGGFAKTSLVASQGGRSVAWQRSFAANAAANGWKTEMVWFKIVDEAPN